jgi:potassium efflux system protein
MRVLPSLSLIFYLKLRIIIVAILLLFFSHTTIFPCLTHAAAAQRIESSPTQSTEIKENEQLLDRGLALLTPKTTELAKKMLDMQGQLNALNINEQTAQQLVSLSKQVTHLEEQIRELESDPQGSRQQLADLQIKLKATERRAKLVAQEVVSAVAKLDYWMGFWDAEKNDIEDWKKGLGISVRRPAVINTFEELQAVFTNANEIIDAKLPPLLKMQKKAGTTQVTLYRLIQRVGDLFKSKYKFDQHTNFIFSSNYFNQFDSQLWQRVLAGVSRVFTPDFSYLEHNKKKLLLTLLFFVLLSTILQKGHQTLLNLPHWRFIGERPRAVALLVSLWFLIPQLDEMTPFWMAAFRIAILLNMLRLSKVILANTFRKKVVKWFMLLLLVTNLLIIIALPMVLLRIYILLVSFILIGVVLVFICRPAQTPHRPAWINWCGWTMVLALSTVILAEVSGNPDLAYYIFVAVFMTLFATLAVYILYLSIAGLLGGLLYLSPVPYLKESAGPISAAVRPLLIISSFIYLIITILVAWEVFPTAYDALTELGSLGFSLQGTRISIGLILSAVLVLYAAYSISRMVQAVLLSSVLPGQNIHRGTQLSIARLLHYAFVMVGLLFALSTLGFNMTNLTILGGALGVGIGFGLQAIFSNFAAGIILLFERPIKVGDTIRIGTELGEIKELGLRATVIETFDNAEIVVPNSELVTTQVTNWTRRKRQVRVKVPVGVAYDSDIEKVLKILTDCAMDNPQVLSSPEPSAVLLAFGVNSLDFVLRCFVPDIDNQLKVQSELITAIHGAFADEGIEIPFPQSDLHLRSVTPTLQQMFYEK